MIEKAKLGNCRVCGANPEGENFKGVIGDVCTHGDSQNGWHVVIVKKIDWFSEGQPEKYVVDSLYCKSCYAKHNEGVERLLADFLPKIS